MSVAILALRSRNPRGKIPGSVVNGGRDETKQRRIDKVLPMIESGVGLNDKYRDC